MNVFDNSIRVMNWRNLKYKGFYIKDVCRDYSIDGLYCLAYKDLYEEPIRGERGQLLDVIYHAPVKLSFAIEDREFTFGDEPIDVIVNRFHAEVDYYLKEGSSEDDAQVTNPLIREYVCPCCGTHYTTDKEGYTPKCENCGALMELEVPDGSK